MGQSKTCPVPDEAENYDNDGTAHTPMLYVSGVTTAITLLISVSLIITHLRRYRCPKEQRQIIRISFAPFVFAIVSFFEVLDYRIAPYIDPIGDFYEALGLCALLLLYIQYAAPGGTFDEDTFEAVKAAEEVGQDGNATNFDWPKITWVMVFQYPLTEILAIIVQVATEAAGDYCVQSLSPKFGHLWVEIISSVGVGAAVLAILRFYGRMKSRMKVSRGLYKLLSFKLIVGLRFLQSTVFSILLNQNVIKPSNTFTYNDILYGLENTLLCGEMAILALGFWYAFSSTEYSSEAKPGYQRVPTFRAVLDALNPWDLIAGIGRLFGLVLHLQNSGGFKQYAAAKKLGKTDKARNRRGKGRYQTGDGMESLTRPEGVHGRNESVENDTSYPMLGVNNGQSLYQPPSGSPPGYDGRLSAEPYASRGTSPNGRVWDGQRYDQSPSPAGRFAEGRDMV